MARDGFVPLHQGLPGHWLLICMTFNYGNRVKFSTEWGWISGCGSVCLTVCLGEVEDALQDQVGKPLLGGTY